MKKNEIFKAEIIDTNNLGFGVCRINDKVVFVSGAVTGDIAEIKIIKTAPSYSVGIPVSFDVKSPMRCQVSCPVSSSCGGCAYSLINYTAELESKKRAVIYAMKKAGVYVDVADVLSTGRITGYRNKAQYPVACNANTGRIYAGFYAPKTHRVIEATRCMLQPEVFSDITEFILAFLNDKKVSAYSEETGKGTVRHIYLRRAEAEKQIMVCLVVNSNTFELAYELAEQLKFRFPEITSFMLNHNTTNTNVILGKNFTLISGKPYIEDILCGVKVRISPDGFYQVNREGAELLYNTGIKAASLKKGDLVLDLYCGAGMISLAASKIVPEIKIIGVEIVESAVENARLNARANGVYDAEYYQGDASDLDSILACRKEKPACVIVDPPRKGCAASTLDYIVKTGTEKILYISCDPDTLARDMAILTGKGYAPSTSVIPVDMFPRTGHVETVVLMTRNI